MLKRDFKSLIQLSHFILAKVFGEIHDHLAKVVCLTSAPISDNSSKDECIQGVSFERREVVDGLKSVCSQLIGNSVRGVD